MPRVCLKCAWWLMARSDVHHHGRYAHKGCPSDAREAPLVLLAAANALGNAARDGLDDDAAPDWAALIEVGRRKKRRRRSCVSESKAC